MILKLTHYRFSIKKEIIFKDFVKNHCSNEHIKSFKHSFYFKSTKKINNKKWDYLKKQSFNQTKEYLKTHKIQRVGKEKSNQINLNQFQSDTNLKYFKIFIKKLSFYKFSFKIFIKDLLLKTTCKIKE